MKYLLYASIAWLVWAAVMLVVFALTGIWLGNRSLDGLWVWAGLTFLAWACLGVCREMLKDRRKK